MTSVPHPAPQTYAAAIERAERAERLVVVQRDALAAVAWRSAFPKRPQPAMTRSARRSHWPGSCTWRQS